MKTSRGSSFVGRWEEVKDSVSLGAHGRQGFCEDGELPVFSPSFCTMCDWQYTKVVLPGGSVNPLLFPSLTDVLVGCSSVGFFTRGAVAGVGCLFLADSFVSTLVRISLRFLMLHARETPSSGNCSGWASEPP